MKKSFLHVASLFFCVSLTAANLIPGDSSFETGFGIMPEYGRIVETDVVDGKCALLFGGSLISYNQFTLTPGKKYVFSVWLKSKKPVSVSLRAYRTNWDGNFPTITVKTTPEWKRFALHIPEQKFGSHNIFWLQLLVNDKNAEVLADALQLEEGDSPSSYQSAEAINMECRVVSPVKGNLFFTNEQPHFLLSFRSNMKETAKRKLSVAVTDYFGKRIFEEEDELVFAPGEKKTLKFIQEKHSGKGFFMIRCSLTGGKEPNLERTASYCVLAPPVPRDPSKRSLFGCTGIPFEAIEAAGRMGVKALAVSVRWAYQSKDGSINFTNTDAHVDKMLENGIEPVILLRRTPSWAAMKQHPHDIFPPRDEFREAYGEFAYRTALHYKGKAGIYQVWGGESDLQSRHQSQELGKTLEWYAMLLARMCEYGYKGIKKADPGATVQTPAVSGVDASGGRFPWQRRILALAKGYYDEVVIHPYCYPWYFAGERYVQSPEESGLENVCREISDAAGGKKMMNGEYGFEISSREALDSPASKRLADYIVRSFLLSMESGRVSTLLYSGISTSRGERTFSVFNWPDPRPAVAAYSALAHLFTYAEHPRRFDLGSMVRGLIMESSRKTRVGALWVPDNKPIPFLLERDSSLAVFDIMGNPVGGKNLLLSGTPIFFETEKSRADLEKQLLSGKLMIRELSVEGRLQDARTIRFYLKNQLQRNISGTLELTVPLKGSRPKHFSVPFAELRPGIIETVVLRLDNDIAPTSTPIEGIAKTATSSGKFSVPVELIVCPYIAERPKIDGDISEWMKHPALTLETIDFLSPPDAVSHGMWTGNADLSIKAWLGWDSEYFYFAARVSDDIHVRKEGNVFAGDCLQIAFDTRNDALARGYGRDDFEFGFALGMDNKPLYSRTWPLPPAVPETILFSARRGNGVTDYEIAIPFKLLKPLGPVKGKVFGFNFVALDADLSASTDYWMGYTYGICGGKDPSVFKKFILGR